MTGAANIAGMVAAGFESVRLAFAEGQSIDRGGAQLCIYRHGERVVDLWTTRDREHDRDFDGESLTVLMSCTKGAVALAANMLSERGLLDFDAPVARYWPEFAAGGKSGILVRHLLTHAAGLMGYDPESGMGASDILDWQKSTDALARMTPLWTPGTAYLYHFLTFGFLLGEVMRRITGKSFGHFFHDEIASPLGLEMWIGLPEAEEHRVAHHFSSLPAVTEEQWRALFAASGIDAESRLSRAILHAFKTTDEAIHRVLTTRAGHAAEIPAGNGIGNARALARMYASMIGPVDGVRLLKAETMERARTPQTIGLGAPGNLRIFSRGEPQWFGFGFELPRESEPMLGKGSFGHAGAGGRMGFAHPESGIAVAYVANNMLWNNLVPDPRWVPWTEALREIAGLK